MSRRALSSAALAGSFLVLAGTARGQGQAFDILGRDDAQFARELYLHGFADLAEGVCSAMLAKGESKDALMASALMLEVRQAAIRTERDLERRHELIAAVLRESEDFLKQHPGTPEAEVVLNSIQEATLLFGETIAALMQEEDDPALFAELRKEGTASFSKVEGALRTRLEEIEKLYDDPSVDLETVQQQGILASYDLARTLYFHSLLFTENDPNRDYYLTRAIDAFRDFGLDYGDQLLNFEGLIYQGLCHKTLGKADDALTDFDDAIALREAWPKEKDGRYHLDARAANIVSSAVLQKVLLLTELERHPEVATTVQDFLDTIPDPLLTSQGLAVVAALADSQIAAGNAADAQKTAQKLVDADPKGPWGLRGRELQGLAMTDASSVDVGSETMIRAAEALAVKGSFDRAIEVCRRALAHERARGGEGSGVDAFLMMGSIYVRRGMLHEASMAFDAALEEFPKDAKAPEAVYRGLNTYLELYRLEANPYYRKLADERKKSLLNEHGSSTFAARVKLVEGKELEAEGKFPEAARLYQEVAADSPDKDEANYRAGNCLLQHARNQQRAGQTAEAKTAFERAETLLRQAVAGLEKSFEGTLEREAQARLGGLAFAARAALIQLFLTPGLGREEEVFPILDEVDQKYAFDPETISRAWGFRIQALQALGKLDEAVAQLEILIKKDPNSRGVPPAAGVLARALDLRADELLSTNPTSVEAADLWRQASTYYLASVEGKDGSLLVSGDVVDSVATRLFVMGLHFNRVPEGQESFLGWEARRTTEPHYWQKAAGLFEKANTAMPSTLTAIRLGRTLGFLGRWEDAARAYASVFDQEPLVDEATKRFRPEIASSRPELILAYLEWGVAEHQAGTKAKDNARLTRAATIFERLTQNLPLEGPIWWQAKYHQLRAMMDRGDYSKADFFMKEVERTTSGSPADDPRLAEDFAALKSELKVKVGG